MGPLLSDVATTHRGMSRPEVVSLIHRCDHLGREIERFLDERDHGTASSADVDDTQAMWATSFSSSALALLRDLREAGLHEQYLPESGPHPDPYSAEKWQAASEARDFLRTGWVDAIGMAHLARYFRVAADRLREQEG